MIEAEKYLQQRNKPIEADSSQESPPQPTSIPLRSASPGAKAQENVQYQKWLPVILASGLFGIISVLLSQTGFLVLGPLSTIFVAPISEEILKLAVPIMILEHKTKLIRNRSRGIEADLSEVDR
jgi:hypothetical protein